METSTPKMASSPQDFDPLIKKINSEDPDIRFMVLGDIQNMLTNSVSTILRNDARRSNQLVEALMDRLDDANGDVQSQALKTVPPLAGRLAETPLKSFLERLVTAKTKNSLDDSIFITAVRIIVTILPRPTTTSSNRLVIDALEILSGAVLPRLTDSLLETSDQGGAKPESIDLAHQVIVCYGSVLTEKDKRSLLGKLLGLLDDSRASIVVQKRAVTALAALSIHLSDSLLHSELIPNVAQRLEMAGNATRKMRMYLSLVGSIAQASRGRLDSSVSSLTSYIFKATSQENFDELTSVAQDEGANVQGEEVVEAALSALDELLSSCGAAMKGHIDEAIISGSRFLSYDPNLIEEEEDEEAMDEDDALELEDEDGDFEDEAGMSDSDDSSWKVRRCAAKVLHTIIRTRPGTDLLENGILYERVAPVLVKRLSEREESVRLEIIAAIARLVRMTGDLMDSSEFALPVNQDKAISRKRRRSSAASFPIKYKNLERGAASPRQTPSPTQGPPGDLAKLASKIAQATLGVLKGKQLASKQAATLLFKDLVIARQGKLDNLLIPVIEATTQIAASGSGVQYGGASAPTGSAAATAATGASLRIESFRLLAAICDSHSSKALAGQISEISAATVSAIEDGHFKVATEAILTSESITKVITPPRSLGNTEKARENIPLLFGVLKKQVQNQSVELEVRTTAIHALGFLLSRTAGQPSLLDSDARSQSCGLLEERLKNEVTRLSAIEAIDCIASGSMAQNDYSPAWLQSIAVELGNQLRKADRALSSASLHTLSLLLLHDVAIAAIDEETSKSLVLLLLPVLTGATTNQLPVAASCVSRIMKTGKASSVEEELVAAVAKLATSAISGNILEAYLELVQVLGSTGAGNALLERLLRDVGVGGSPEVNGAAIGTLMAAGGGGLSVKHGDIISELQSTTDSKRKMLALSVLGQFGFCMGTSSPLQPDVFLENLDDKKEVARAAAIALGKAGAGDPSRYFPLILKSVRDAGDKQAVLVPALREVLSHKSKALPQVTAHADELWSVLLRLSGSEDGKVVAAECVGKLVSMLPEKFVPLLQDQLQSSSADARGLVNHALRYALSDSDRQLDDALRTVIGSMLTTLLRDQSVDNRRLALMTLSAAINNKPSLVGPYLPQLSQVVIERAHIEEGLIHEVSMGPFKHKVDEGLEMRKSAYETLHTLINSAYSRINSSGVFDRVIRGLEDDNDIKALCTLLVGKLLTVDREQSARHLHEYAARFTATLGSKLRDTAVKQEIERAQEANKDVLRATAKINHAFPSSAGLPSTAVEPAVWQSWQAYVSSVRKDHAAALSQAEEEVVNER